MRGSWLLLCGALLAVGCGSSPNPFAAALACKDAPGAPNSTVTPLAGSRQMVISSLAIADFEEGFDLDGDKKPDNKLALLGPLANPALLPEFQKGFQVMIGIEMYGYDGTDSECVKSAFFLGEYVKDTDKDGKTTTWDKGDCLDSDGTVAPNKSENLTNRLDDDCDGFADNMTKGSKPDDTTDADGDGYTLAMGDCDDRADAANLTLAKARHPGATDTCADGIDQDCNGIADDDKACFPFSTNNVEMDITEVSFENSDPSASPYIHFDAGAVKGGVFTGGPSLFSISLPFLTEIQLALKLTATRFSMELTDDGQGRTGVKNGRLGGVIDAVTMSQVTGIDGEGIIRPDQSLLDALFAGQLATVLGLDFDKDGHYLPDMDVDRDGLETFWEESGTTKLVDSCRDGDGTIVRNNFDGAGTPCWLAKDKQGNYRFVDGISLSLKFEAVPVRFGDIVAGPVVK